MKDYYIRVFLIFFSGAIIATFLGFDETSVSSSDIIIETQPIDLVVEEEEQGVGKLYRPPAVTELSSPDENDSTLLSEPTDPLILEVPAGGRYNFPTNHTPKIEWEEFIISILTTDYTFGEVSENVRMLQYYIGANTDGVYGPATYYAHNKALYPYFGTLVSGNYLPTWSSYGATFIDDVERWRATSLEALSLYGQEHQVDRFLRVMQCESRGNPDAFNASSGASGLMQHLENYWPWRAKMAGFEGASPFDPVANIYTSAWLLFEHRAGGWQHWECK